MSWKTGLELWDYFSSSTAVLRSCEVELEAVGTKGTIYSNP